MTPIVGKPAPPINLTADDGSTVSLDQFRGRPIVMYFYPRDDTPTCTRESCDLRDAFPRLRRGGAVVLGISPDSVESHVKFKKKYKLPFPLLSDTDHTVAELYGVWGKKKLFGHSYMGIIRTTFLIDSDGVLRRIIPVSKVAGHAEEVLAWLDEEGRIDLVI